MDISDEFVDKVIESIDGCLSISVNSCEKCMFHDISHPKCKNKLIQACIDAINYSRRKNSHDN